MSQEAQLIPNNYYQLTPMNFISDLLYHIEKSRDLKVEAVTWPRKVDWFEHHTTFQPKPGPYKSPLKDHWSQWKTDVVRLPQLEQHPYPVDDSTPRRRGKATTVPVSNREGVDFGRLLALDYQREWLQKREEKESRRRLVAKVIAGTLTKLVQKNLQIRILWD